MLIRNVKLSVKIESCPLDIVSQLLTKKNLAYKNFGNFLSFTRRYSYVLFKTSSNGLTHVNITKVPGLGRPIRRSLKILRKVLRKKIVSFKIDNIIATSDLKKKISLKKIALRKDLKVIYNNERFPGLFIKFDEGTSILYHSGKVVLVGCKTVHKLTTIEEWLNANI